MERFIADRMLGKLAKWLRVLGYDVLYLRQGRDEEILEGLREGRILLTRDRRAGPWHGRGRVVVVEANKPETQLRELVAQLGLTMEETVFLSRCIECNRVLSAVSREEVRDEVPEYIWQTHGSFQRCADCGRVYWSGSHAEKMRGTLREIFAGRD
jgi:hypothetical protein